MTIPKKAPVAEIAVSLARPRILIVDDDVKFLEGARDYFSSCAFIVDTESSPERAKRLVAEKGEGYYHLLVTDYDFGDESIKGDEFVRENRHLFGKTKVAIISGAVGLTQQIRRQLKEAEDIFLEKSPHLNTRLKDLTQEESAKRASDLKRVVLKEVAPQIERLTGGPVDVRISTGPLQFPRRALPDLAVEGLKRTLIRWLSSRGELDEPVLAYGEKVYSANELIEHVKDETEVGLAHVRMLLQEFEHSLEVNADDSQHHEDEYDAA